MLVSLSAGTPTGSRSGDEVGHFSEETPEWPILFRITLSMSAEHLGPTRVIALALVSTSAWLSITLLPYEVSTPFRRSSVEDTNELRRRPAHSGDLG
jgi:hypothetical protein